MNLPIRRLLVGLFAGALAAFFPRLMAVLAGSPTEEIQLFSQTYLVVGTLVALAVALIILIIESDPARPLRDVFMTALGVPTLVMGALSTSATTQNVGQAQQKIQTLTQALAQASDIPVQSGTPLNLGPSSANQWLDLLPLPSAHAQGAPALQQNRLGIATQEQRYVAVLQQAPKSAELARLQAELQKAGLSTRTVSLPNGQFALVNAGPAKPMSEALLDGIKAKNLGAKPYLVQAK